MTQIEWVLNPDGTRGITVNSKTGCLNHTPEGLCLGGLFPCHGYNLANGRLKKRYLTNDNFARLIPESYRDYISLDSFYPRFWPERLDKIRSLKKPTGIFLDDMSDWMGDYWPREWTRQELQVMRDCPQHRFYTLTKQPQNLPQFSPFPDNCWAGVTATNTKGMNDALYFNPHYKAKVKFISFEPLLECIDKSRLALYRYDWLIIGACTGIKKDMEELCKRYPNLTLMHWKGNLWTAQPRIEDLREIVEAADKAGLKVFLKDNLKPLIASSCTIEDKWVWAKDLGYGGLLRQELPE